MSEKTRITFLGAAAVLPGPSEDTACFLINGTLLIDCGWCAALNMQKYGFDANQIETLFFTHCHHDHYLGLPALLFWRGMMTARRQAPPPLRIVGPPDDLPLVLDLTRRFLQADRFPPAYPEVHAHPHEPGATYEGDGYRIQTIRARHPVTGVSCRYTELRTGVIIAFSGDTGPNPELANLARGADLLIHEASVDPEVADENLRGDHSRATDAARTAVEAGVKRLLLIHIPPAHRTASLEAARAIFSMTDLATEGLDVLLP